METIELSGGVLLLLLLDVTPSDAFCDPVQ